MLSQRGIRVAFIPRYEGRPFLRSKKKKNNRSHSLVTDLVIGTILGLLALSIGRQSRAADMEDFVNAKIKEEFIRMDGEQLRASVEIPQPEQGLQIIPQWPQPLASRDPLINHQAQAASGETTGAVELPRAGISSKFDPTDPIEQRVAEKQARDLYRENYRNALQKEFIQRLHKAGWETTRNIAEELKAKELALPPVY
jgi:hypothetical protein